MEIEVFIEIPKGSRNKYEYDHQQNVIRFDRMLFSSVHYPTDYGFLPDTLSGDGDPLDALILVSEPTFPGCVIQARAVGLFVMHDEKGEDEKILGVPLYDPLWNHITALDDVPPHLLKEVEHFFSVYKDLESKQTRIEGWKDEKHAVAAIVKAQKSYAETKTAPAANDGDSGGSPC